MARGRLAEFDIDWDNYHIRKLVKSFVTRHFLAPRTLTELVKEIGILAGIENISFTAVSKYVRHWRENPELYSDKPPTMVKEDHFAKNEIVVSEATQAAVQVFVADIHGALNKLRAELHISEKDAMANTVNFGLSELKADSRLEGIEIAPINPNEEAVSKLGSRSKQLFVFDSYVNPWSCPLNKPSPSKVTPLPSPAKCSASFFLSKNNVHKSPSVVTSPESNMNLEQDDFVDPQFLKNDDFQPGSSLRAGRDKIFHRNLANNVITTSSHGITFNNKVNNVVSYSPSKFNVYRDSLKRTPQKKFGESIPAKIAKIDLNNISQNVPEANDNEKQEVSNNLNAPAVDFVVSDDDFGCKRNRKIVRIMRIQRKTTFESTTTPLFGLSDNLQDVLLICDKSNNIREYSFVAKSMNGEQRYCCSHCQNRPVARATVSPDGFSVTYDDDDEHKKHCDSMTEKICIKLQLDRHGRRELRDGASLHQACSEAHNKVLASGLNVTEEILCDFMEDFFNSNGI